MNLTARTLAAFVTTALAATTLTVMASTSATADDDQPWPTRIDDLTWAEPWLYFVGDNDDKQLLWRTNGLTAEPIDITPGHHGTDYNDLTPFAGALYANLEAWSNDDYIEGLWRVEPDTSEPALIIEGHVDEETVWGEWLYFSIEGDSAEPDTWQSELWRTNGTAVEKLETFPELWIEDFTVADGWLYFTTSMDQIDTIEVWRTNGTDVTLFETVADTRDGHWPQTLVALDGWVYLHTGYFWESDIGMQYGTDLWRTQGAGADLVIWDGFGYEAVEIATIASLGGNLLVDFWYLDSDHNEGRAVHRTDGNQSFVVAEHSGDRPLTVLGDWAYFEVFADPAQTLWRTNGTTTELFTDHDMGSSSLALLDGWVYFISEPQHDGTILWRSDGTTSQMVTNINPGPHDSSLTDATVIGNWLYFVLETYNSDTSSTEYEAWRTNGTETQRVRDLNMGLPGNPPFTDVGNDHPFVTQITWLAQSGITEGYEDGTFRPTAHVSRQAMAAFLYRAAGEPAFTAPVEASFTDVATTHPFFHEIEWLVDEGITEGYEDGTFRPGAHVSRQAMAAFLHRFGGEPTFTAPVEASFTDVATTHPFFHEIEWLVDEGITEGYDDGTFRPGAHVSRQAMAAFLYRVIEGTGMA